MNFLAHIYLSPPHEDAQLGSLLGDFVKGPIDGSEISSRYGEEVKRAIALHRRIDSYTDAHPAVVASRNRISTNRRRFAGVMVDSESPSSSSVPTSSSSPRHTKW